MASLTVKVESSSQKKQVHYDIMILWIISDCRWFSVRKQMFVCVTFSVFPKLSSSICMLCFWHPGLTEELSGDTE